METKSDELLEKLKKTEAELKNAYQLISQIKKEAKSKARESNQLVSQIFESIPDLFFLMDEDLIIIDYRAGRQDDLYEKPNNFLGKSMLSVLPTETADIIKDGALQSKQTQQVVTVEYMLPISGEAKYFEARINNQHQSNHVVVIVREISERKAYEDKILHQAHHDCLTQLPNRVLAFTQLEQLIKESKRDKSHTAVIFIDVDHFKEINDQYGHAVGDQLLVQIADRLVNSVREEDIVARIGGDEFIIIVNRIKQTQALNNLADKLIETFNTPFTIKNMEVFSTVSIGISISGIDGNTGSELLNKADSAMYAAKGEGKNRFVWAK
jgi:diguanylate cyclase (GGDEF)-like protein